MLRVITPFIKLLACLFYRRFRFKHDWTFVNVVHGLLANDIIERRTTQKAKIFQWFTL